MEITTPKTSNIAIKWAVIYLVTSIVFTYIIQLLNIDPTSPLKYLGYIFFIGFLVLAQKEYKDQAGGFITFNQAFVQGLLYAVYSGIMLAVFMYIYLKFLSPQVLELSMAGQREKLEAKGNLSKDQIDTAMELATKYGALFAAIGTLFIIPIIGAIIALITGAIIKKERTPLDVAEGTATDPAS